MHDIRDFLPQKHQQIYVDEITSFKYNTMITGNALIRESESLAIGEPENRVLPGAVVMDVMSQFSGLLIIKPNETMEDKIFNAYLYKIDKLIFFSKCRPKDIINVKCKYIGNIGNFHKIQSQLFVEGRKAAEGRFTYSLTSN